MNNPGRMHKYITPLATETMVHAFISTTQDYTNVLPVCLLIFLHKNH